MKTKRTNLTMFCMMGLLFAAEIHAAKFPAYLKMDGTKIIGCDQASLPANLVIPDGVTEIGYEAFAGCTSLVTVSIPTSVKNIGGNAFGGCENIKTAQYRGTLSQWCQTDNDWSLFYYAKTVTMFDVADLKAMTTLTIPEGVTNIGRAAFYYCEDLNNITIPDGVSKISEYAFMYCKSLVNMSIPYNVTEIGGLAFFGCESLTSITVPDGVSEIGYKAFADCAGLTTISIPASITNIGLDAFENCNNIKTVQYRGTLAQWCQMDNDWYLVGKAKTITLSDVIDLKAATSLAIPKGVSKVGHLAFSGCRSLINITISDGITEIGYEAFANCTSLATVSIPASLKSIGRDAFEGCKNIKTVQYKGTLAQWSQMDNDPKLIAYTKTITISDLADLKAATALTISKGVTKIGGGAFANLNSLKSLTIPEGVTEIGAGSFAYCTSLADIEIPSSVTVIRGMSIVIEGTFGSPTKATATYGGAFSNCTSLAKITFTGTTTQWGAIDKTDRWNLNVPAKKVICKNGEAELN